MGKPAARMADPVITCNDPSDLPVGKIIAASTVLINGLPAAKQGDQVMAIDIHIVMIPSPAGPVPTPLPHPFVGMLDGDLSPSVKIEGKPAATKDSIAHNQPPHIPQGGPFQKPPSNQGKVMMGSLDVFIDAGGGGGGGAGGGGQAQQSAGQSQEVEEGEHHYLDVKFVDRGGKLISGVAYSTKSPDGKVQSGALTGQIRYDGATEGDYEISLSAITLAQWSKKSARDGETVKIKIETAGVQNGTKAEIDIWQRSVKRADRKIASINDKNVQGDKVEAEWKYVYVSESDDEEFKKVGYDDQKYVCPSFYFTVKIGALAARSPVLEYKDFVEIDLKDQDGKPMANVRFVAYLPNGEVREGQLDGSGYKKLEHVPPGKWAVKFPENPVIYLEMGGAAVGGQSPPRHDGSEEDAA